MNPQEQCPALYKNAGLFQSEETWIHPCRVIDTFEIILPVKGEVCLFEGERQYTLTEGELLVLHPGVPHGGWRESRGETSFFWVHFTPAEPGETPMPEGPVACQDSARLGALCRQLLHAANAPVYPAYGVQAAFALVYCEVRLLWAGERPASRLAAQAAEWIRIHSHRRLTAASVAAHFGYHPDYLSTLFREAYGMGLKQYIVEERMKQVRGLLLAGMESVKEIAAHLDFADEAQLNHFFRYHEGMSPARYRNLHCYTHLNRA